MKRVFILSTILMIAGAMNAWATLCSINGTTFTDSTFGAINIKQDGDNCVATLDPDATTDTANVNIPDNITIDQFVYDRDFSVVSYIEGEKSVGQGIKTICLPFGGSYSGGNLYEIVRIENNWKWQIIVGDRNRSNMTPQNTFEAGVPYFVVASSNAMTFTPSTPINTGKLSPVPFGTNEEWQLRGTYSYKEWKQKDSLEIKHTYGFAASDGGEGSSVKAGQFVKVKAGAFIKPMRAYLYYNKKSANAGRPAANGVNGFAAIDDEDLPSSIEVVFQDANGEIQSIAKMNTVTGEFTSVTGWYDMKGRKLNKKPTQKGTYFNNGKKVVIK